MRLLLLTFGLFFLSNPLVFAQSHLEIDPNDLVPGGGTVSLGNNGFRLTNATTWQGGTVWYRKPVNLREPFEMHMQLFFGCKDEGGADGMVFVWHPERVDRGYRGEGMAFGGLRPALGVEIDTYQNIHLNDPREDHVALLVDGNMQHFGATPDPRPVGNVENCEVHQTAITWEPAKQLVQIELDGQIVLAEQLDVIKGVFNGRDQVYWGVSAATGKKYNRQEIIFDNLIFNQPELGYSYKRDLLLGELVDLEDIQFENNSARLSKGSIQTLDKIWRFFEKHPDQHLEIFSHVSSMGSASQNDLLSKRRAEAIRDYLISKGIDKQRLMINALGGKFPEPGKPGSRTAIRFFKPIP